MLLFKTEYRETILSGRKTTTLRNWKRRMVRVGQVVATNIGIALIIEDVRDIALADIDDSIIASEGRVDRADLLTRLSSSYGDQLPETLTLIRFRLAPRTS